MTTDYATQTDETVIRNHKSISNSIDIIHPPVRAAGSAVRPPMIDDGAGLG
jgi:hypothetical protein